MNRKWMLAAAAAVVATMSAGQAALMDLDVSRIDRAARIALKEASPRLSQDLLRLREITLRARLQSTATQAVIQVDYEFRGSSVRMVAADGSETNLYSGVGLELDPAGCCNPRSIVFVRTSQTLNPDGTPGAKIEDLSPLIPIRAGTPKGEAADPTEAPGTPRPR